MSELPESPSASSEASAEEERAVKLQELQARQAEANAKLKSLTAPWWSKPDPLVLAVAAGVITLAGNIGVAWYNSRESTAQERLKAENSLKLEKEQAKSNLIIKAVSTDDPKAAQRNILFFLDSGLLPDADDKIRQAAMKYNPTLPALAGASSPFPLPVSADDYASYFWQMQILPQYLSKVDALIKRMIANRQRFDNVANKTNVPWFVIGLLCFIETAGNFSVHLSNGDPLSARTVHVPAGRPPEWPPPDHQDPWEYSAVDTLLFGDWPKTNFRDVGAILMQFEHSNGGGYRRHNIFSPYVWNFTSYYERGKFVADGVFDQNSVSQIPGAAAILRRMHDEGIINLLAP